ncbi:MAG: hypothetical protein FJ138_18015 [Deltaproteobacteria bacterium]|nr:hypothetical protein [Deltaproteobacteria bacterium]
MQSLSPPPSPQRSPQRSPQHTPQHTPLRVPTPSTASLIAISSLAVGLALAFYVIYPRASFSSPYLAPPTPLAGPMPPDPATFGPACKTDLDIDEVQDLLSGTLHFVVHYRAQGEDLGTQLVSHALTMLSAGIGDDLGRYKLRYDDVTHTYSLASGAERSAGAEGLMEGEGFTMRAVWAESSPLGEKGAPVAANLFAPSSYLKASCTDPALALCAPGCQAQVITGPLWPLLGSEASSADLSAVVARGCEEHQAAKARVAACKERLAALKGGAEVAEAKHSLGAFVRGEGTLGELGRSLKQAREAAQESGKECAQELHESARELADAAAVVRRLLAVKRPRWELLEIGLEAHSRKRGRGPERADELLELRMTTPPLPVAFLREAAVSGQLTLTVDGTRYTSPRDALAQTFTQGAVRLVPKGEGGKRFTLEGAWRASVTRQGDTWFAYGTLSSTRANETWWFCDEGLTRPFGRSVHDLDLKGGELTRPDGDRARYLLRPY